MKKYTLYMSVFFSVILSFTACSSMDKSDQKSSVKKLSVAAKDKTENPLVFNPDAYTVKSISLKNKTIKYRAFENIIYVKFPIDTKLQSMNVYVPEDYYQGKTIENFSLQTAPIFFPNMVGGYMPADPASPENKRMGPPPLEKDEGRANAIIVALSKGFVVAAPGLRGRTTQDKHGKYTGKAPAAIVDLKAAVRFLRFNDKVMPGDSEKIISSGTSAGGALSSLLGATGNSRDYKPYLEEVGAAAAQDHIFAASCYCPITNLDNADIAYEWQFSGIYTYKKFQIPQMIDWRTQRKIEKGTLTQDEIDISNVLSLLFPQYINGLGLKTSAGTVLKLSKDGNGNFKEYVKSFIIESAQKALDNGRDISSLTWIKIIKQKVKDIDFHKYVQYMGRMKVPPAFDGLKLNTGENELFGSETINARHFTQFGLDHSLAKGLPADPTAVKLMNPMNYIGKNNSTIAKYWRIRHGTIDSDTSLAVPVILSTILQNNGYDVDFVMPWGQGHGGDYDLDDLFAWISQICR